MKKFLIAYLAIAAIAFFANPALAADVVIYNNIPSPQPGNLPSLGYEATQTFEFGGQLQFADTSRNNPKVTVLMSSWGCETGHWYSGDCSTSSGATFSTPITLNIYSVNTADNSPGTKIGSITQTFNIPYRPSASSICGDGRWSDGTNCFNGFATPITFDIAGLTLPDKVIVGIAYNTSHYGYAPIGNSAACYSSSGGCGYDSLNVAVIAPPSVGSLPVPDDAYISSQGSSTFHFDMGGWTGQQPAIRVEASTPVKEFVGKATGGLTLKNPNQEISFNAFDYGDSSFDEGSVEYQNFEYAGGLHYTTKVLCANVNKTEKKASFMFQIPEGFPGLSGIYVVSSIYDGGTPGAKGDTYGHAASWDLATAKDWCEKGTAPVGMYSISGGNAVVHK